LTTLKLRILTISIVNIFITAIRLSVSNAIEYVPELYWIELIFEDKDYDIFSLFYLRFYYVFYEKANYPNDCFSFSIELWEFKEDFSSSALINLLT
jgi:hypothetical protein